MTASDLLKTHNDHAKMQAKKAAKAELQNSNTNATEAEIIIAD